MTEAIRTLRDWTARSNRIVFFGGAGVSTESGIPDFRSTGGLYNQEYAYPPETILTRRGVYTNPPGPHRGIARPPLQRVW